MTPLRIILVVIPLLLLCAVAYALLLPSFYLKRPPIPPDLKGHEKAIVVDLQAQTLYAYQNDVLLRAMLTCTGRRANQTPIGDFAVGWKAEDYTSREYAGAPMPHSMFFVVDRGIAIHGSKAIYWRWRGIKFGGDFGSGGCVSLRPEDAKVLFDWAPKKTPVFVLDSINPNKRRPPAPVGETSGDQTKT